MLSLDQKNEKGQQMIKETYILKVKTQLFSQLIKKHEELSESLGNIDLVSEGTESIIHSFTKITMNTFVKIPQWFKN